MTAFITCRSCADRKACDIRDGIRQAIRGRRITSLKHSCANHRLPFETGQAVWAKVQQRPHSVEDGYYQSPPSHEWFPGHFVGISTRINTRGIVFIPYDAPARDDADILFAPIRDEPHGGVCTVLWKYIAPRNAAPASSCPTCKQLEGMKCEGPDIGPPCPMKTANPAPRPQIVEESR